MPRTLILPAAAVGLVLLLALGMLVYDGSTSDTVPKGVKVANVDIGGLSTEEARERLSAQLLKPLAKPLTIPVADREFQLSGREARINADVEAIVDDAIEQGRAGGIFARTWRGITGGERNITIKPRIRHSAAAVDRLVDRVERALNRSPVDAKVDFQPGNVAIRASRTGRRVDAKRFRASVVAALVSPVGDRTVKVPVKTTKPKVPSDKLANRYPVVLTVDRDGFRLSLYKRLKQVKTYPIALGRAGLETPSGLYKIQNKAVNPAWTVPNAAWAGPLAGQVIPSGAPNNPLKARWLGVYDGVGVHGTDARASIGTNASAGCIRMLVEDVTELYDEVPVGAAIYIG